MEYLKYIREVFEELQRVFPGHEPSISLRNGKLIIQARHVADNWHEWEVDNWHEWELDEDDCPLAPVEFVKALRESTPKGGNDR